MKESIYIRENNNIIYIRAIGHITANCCPDLRNRVFDRLDAKPPVEDVFIDLSQCDYMDSTFMGLLVGFNKRFSRFSDHKVTLFCPNEACTKLLKTIGILKLLSVKTDIPDFPESLDLLESQTRAGIRLVLKAHENLIEISEENKRRFETLHNTLNEAIKNNPE